MKLLQLDIVGPSGRAALWQSYVEDDDQYFSLTSLYVGGHSVHLSDVVILCPSVSLEVRDATPFEYTNIDDL